MSSLIFVYGTLKRGLSNHGWMRGQRYVAEARTQAVYRLFDLGGYPGLVPVAAGEPAGCEILGEIWEVDAECRQRLDVLEGVEEGDYALVDVALQKPWDDRAVLAYVYLRPVKGRRDCGGCWME